MKTKTKTLHVQEEVAEKIKDLARKERICIYELVEKMLVKYELVKYEEDKKC